VSCVANVKPKKPVVVDPRLKTLTSSPSAVATTITTTDPKPDKIPTNDNMTGTCPSDCRLVSILKAKAEKDHKTMTQTMAEFVKTLPVFPYRDCRPIFVAISQGDVAKVKTLLSDPMLRVQNITHGGLTPIEFALAGCTDNASTAAMCSILMMLKEAGVTIRRGLYRLDYKIGVLSREARLQLFSTLQELPTEYDPDDFAGYELD
jgi:hypothetical protein